MIQAKVPEGLPKWMSDHVDRYLKSGGADGHMYTIKPQGMDKEIAVPSLLLVTKGRKSGEKYLFPLFYGETGKSYYIVASKGGAPDHPGWYKNLLANPDVELVADGERQAVRARTAEPHERAELWPRIVTAYRGYAGYQKNTDREIPVVILEPRT